MRGVVLGVVLVCAGLLGASCGGSDGDEKAGTGGSGADAGTTGGAGGSAGAGGSSAAGGSGGSGGGSGDMCGGKPCANYTGEKEFSDPTAPGDASNTFKGATPKNPGTDPNKEPAVIYPSHETMFPVNVSHIRHDWSGGTGNDLFMLTFKGPKTTVKVYTKSPT